MRAGLRLPDVLRASHANTWADCESDEELLDVFNGFLLVAQLDSLLDRGLITFDSGGGMVDALHLAADHRALPHLDEGLRLRRAVPEHLPFTQWHRDYVFRG